MRVLNTILCIKMKLPALVKVSLMYFYPIVADYKILLVWKMINCELTVVTPFAKLVYIVRSQVFP